MNCGNNYSRLFRLDSRRAVVIGAGSGLGREAALALVANGASVICVDRDAAAAQETASLCLRQLDADQEGAEEQKVRAEILVVTDAKSVSVSSQRFSHREIILHFQATH